MRAAALALSQGAQSFGLIKLTGIILGVLLLFAAIRAMFGGKRRK
jgi:hypothetical protein